VNLRERTRTLVSEQRLAELEALLAAEPRAVRYVLALSYQLDENVRATACRAIGMASHHHPEQIGRVIRQLIWAMNDESGTNAQTAPAVLAAIAREQPELLLPVVPDLTRLAADPALYEGLAATLRTVAERCPGRVGPKIGASLRKQLKKGRTRGSR
jgi:hypothetical protein